MKFDDINLVPRELSNISSRAECDTTISFCDTLCSLPIIPSPMIDVIGNSNIHNLNNQGIFTYLHRFQPVENQIELFLSLSNPNLCGLSVGLGENERLRFKRAYQAGCRRYLIDTANGASAGVLNMVQYINDIDIHCYITIGNFISIETIDFLLDKCKIDAVRLFIGSGHACATKYNTGIHRDEVDCLLECRELDIDLIADGGISNVSHFVKSIALGARMVMCGSLFAACEDSPAIKNNGCARYRGSSYSDDKDKKYIEGYAKNIQRSYDSSSELINSFKEGLQSAMSYFNARNLEEFRSKFYNKNIEGFDSGSTIVYHNENNTNISLRN